MNKAPSFDDIFAVMSAASVGDMATRVVMPDSPQIDDTATKFALALNILLDDLALSAAQGKRELAEHERLASRLQILADSSREFSAATGTLDRLLEIVARRLGETLGDMCAVRTMTEDGEWLESGGAVYHRDSELLAATREVMLSGRQRVGEGVSGRVVATGRPLIAPKVSTSDFAESTEPRYRPFLERIGVSSAITLPLTCRGKVVGVANLIRSNPGHPYDEDDLRFAQSLADHAALAIGNTHSLAAERVARDAADRAANALGEARARFARLSESGIVGVVVHDLGRDDRVLGRDNRVVEVNDALLDMLGYSRDEILAGRVAWKDLTPTEWSEVDARAIDQLVESGIGDLREKEFVRKDGKRVPVLMGSAMLEGEARQCISFVLDLTERKEAERGRREAERRSQRIVESAMVGMWIFGVEGRTTFMNARMAAILGMNLAEAARTPIAEFFLPEDHSAMGERLAQRGAGLANAYETKFRRADGSVGLLAIEASPMYDAQGRYEGVLGIVSDITERKQAQAAIEQLRHERALGEQKARLAAIVDASDDAIIGKTLEGVITSWNPGAHRIFGYSADEAVGKSISLLIPPGRESEEPAILEHLARGQVERFDTVRRRKDGRDIDVSVTSSPVRDAAGQVVGISKVARDITDRIRAEAALARAKDAAEAASRELEAFSYSVAHDLRAPLRGMNGFARVLLDKYREQFDEEGQDWLQEILLNAKKMGSLIDGLLSLAQWTRSELRPERVDLSAIVRDVVERLRASEPHRTVELQLEDKLCADVDSRLARALLENLLGNAWKFTSKAPTARIEFGATEKDGFAAFFVRDNGAGFDMAYASKLFAPFQRLHTTDEFPGTGIGLATVQRIVQRHGGHIWAEGAVDGGATFWFAFPARPGSMPCTK
jgi:PAS domain S-box-containing protein